MRVASPEAHDQVDDDGDAYPDEADRTQGAGSAPAEEVCERLEISRASASVQLNAILGWGLARRMYLPGDRRQHYLAEPEPWTWFRRAVRVR